MTLLSYSTAPVVRELEPLLARPQRLRRRGDGEALHRLQQDALGVRVELLPHLRVVEEHRGELLADGDVDVVVRREGRRLRADAVDVFVGDADQAADAVVRRRRVERGGVDVLERRLGPRDGLPRFSTPHTLIRKYCR